MPTTEKFSTLSGRAKQDPVRAARIAEAKAVALREQAEYHLGELRQPFGLTQADDSSRIGRDFHQ